MKPVCERPGCVAAAVADGLCTIHLRGLGVPCAYCRGSGRVVRVDGEHDARTVSAACDRCGGTGLKDAKRSKLMPKNDRERVDERGLIAQSEKDGEQA